jgi:hypothetical protein
MHYKSLIIRDFFIAAFPCSSPNYPKYKHFGSRMGHKNQKGAVSITQYNGGIRLRWRKDCKRYSINLYSYTELTLIQAKRVALHIEQDIILGIFDESIIKYTCKKSKKYFQE